MPIFQGCLVYKHPSKDNQKQRQSVPLLAKCEEMQEAHRELLLTISTLYFYMVLGSWRIFIYACHSQPS